MQLTKTNSNNLYFPPMWKNYSLLLLLVGLFAKCFGQIYVAENTIVSIKEGTLVQISENIAEGSQKGKIFVSKNSATSNFSSDSLVQIVYIENEIKPKKIKEAVQQKPKINKSESSSIAKKEINKEETIKSVLVFISEGKPPASLLYAGKTTKVALGNAGNFGVKSFPYKKLHNHSIYTYYLNENQQVKMSPNEILLQHQIHLENQITRPPPTLIKSQSEIS